MSDELTPEERAEQLLGKLKTRTTEKPKKSSSFKFDKDLIPDVAEPTELTPEQQELEHVIEGIDIVDAYSRLIGKMQPEAGNKTDGVMISCPMPGHADNNPSAWINTEKKTWFCSGCSIGGDVYDLAAIHFGYDVYSYKTKEIFPRLKKQLGELYGFRTVKDTITGKEYVVTPEVEEAPKLASVSPISNFAEEEQDEDDLLSDNVYINWEDIAAEGTFLRDWMNSTTIDDLPHEYYFWLGLMALGFCAGKNNLLMDYQPVKPNLYLCLYGKTGIGKSRSIRPFLDLLGDVFPYAEDAYEDPQGVRLLPTPNSAEAIIDSFHYEVKDSSTQKFDHYGSVSALLRHEELSGLIKKSERSGSSLKEVLIEMYDVLEGNVSTHSRSSGIKQAHSPFCQMLSTTQPNAIHAFLRKTDVESGFLNRWVFAAGKGRIEPIAYGGVAQDITSAKTLLKDTYAWAFTGHNFVLHDEALDVWTTFFNEQLADYKSGRVEADSILSRVDLILKKIIIHLTVNEREPQPTGDIVEKALKLYDYLCATYALFSQDINFNDSADCQDRIIQVVDLFEARNENPSARDLYRAMRRKFDTEMISKTIKLMIEVGVLEPIPPPPGAKGRPTVKYAHNA